MQCTCSLSKNLQRTPYHVYSAVRRVFINLSLFFLQKVQYVINPDTKTCYKSVPPGPFQTMDIPTTAHFVAEMWIGVEGLVGAGFSTELWAGTTPNGTYIQWNLINWNLQGTS